MKDEHEEELDSIESNFEILKKCQRKLGWLILEMVFIRKLKPKLNKQSDSAAISFILCVYCFYVNILEF